MRPADSWTWSALALGLVGCAVVPAIADTTLRDSFEGREVQWQRSLTDAQYELSRHEVTQRTAHSGTQSEFLALQVQRGSHLYFAYPLGRAELSEELALSLWVKANRPGMRLAARVVLPRERHPQNLQEAYTFIVTGDSYELVGRWQRLELRHPWQRAQEQRQLLRAEWGREVSFEGAYVDQVLLDVYAGPGWTEVWLDDLEAGPVQEPAAARRSAVATPTARGERPQPRAATTLLTPRSAVVDVQQNQLLVNQHPYLVRAIRPTGMPLDVLRQAGFNVLWVDADIPAAQVSEGIRQGFWLVPVLTVEGQDPSVLRQAVAEQVRRYPYADAVLFWSLGEGWTAEQTPLLSLLADTVRSTDPYQGAGRPVAAGLWDGWRRASRSVALLGMHRWPLGTALELKEYRHWLESRRLLASPGVYCWTWIQAHPPRWLLDAVRSEAGADWDGPLGPAPEQLQLLTYLALSAGCRGLAYWPEPRMADSRHARDRLLCLALLNSELQLLEPMLASAGEVVWVPTSHPEVQAAVFRFRGGVLAIPMWLGPGAQYVPGQMAVSPLKVVVPQAPEDAQVWEITPADVRALKRNRVAGGIEVTLPEFGLYSLLLLTSDVQLIGSLQDRVRALQRQAAQWVYDLALEEYGKVQEIHAQLQALAPAPTPLSAQLLAETRKRLEEARLAWQRGTPSDYRDAWIYSQRALRALRLVKRADWERAVQGLDTPIASPLAVSFYSLPAHVRFMQQVRQAQALPNVLETGHFEGSADRFAAWTLEQAALDDVEPPRAELSRQQPKQGQQCLCLTIRPRADGVKEPIPAALDRTFVALRSPAVPAQPGSLVRISAWIRIPSALSGSVDGALIMDNAGGEPLAFRSQGPTPWRQVTLYRRVPDSGTITVTLALTGLGQVFFDDVRIEPLVTSATTSAIPAHTPATGPLYPPSPYAAGKEHLPRR